MEERGNKMEETDRWDATKAKTDKIPSLVEIYHSMSPKMAFQVFHEDPWLHPLRFHENLPHELKQRKGLHIRKNAAYNHIMYGMCIWDLLMSKNRNEDIQIPLFFISQYLVYLQEFDRKKNAMESQDHFTKMFSHLSLEKKNQITCYHDGWEYIGSYHRNLIEGNAKRKKFSS